MNRGEKLGKRNIMTHNLSCPFLAVRRVLRGLRLAERRGSPGTSLNCRGVFPRVGLERLCGRPSFGMVGVSLCGGLCVGLYSCFRACSARPVAGYGGGDVCLYPR